MVSTKQKLRSIQLPGGENLYSKMTQIFIQQAPEQMESLLKAISESHFEDAAFISHRMVSSSGNLGARKLSKMFSKVEALARDHDPSGLDKMKKSLMHEFERFSSTIHSNSH